MGNNHILLAFIVTTFAGLSTGIGAAMAFFTKRNNKKFLSASLGFSAGVMIFVSFVEIWSESNSLFNENFPEHLAFLYTMLSFFGGILLILIIDRLIPSYENPHDVKSIDDLEKVSLDEGAKLKRLGIFTAFAIAIHNFPEGIATFASMLNDPTIGFSIAIAIALHNIPEGIAIAVPLYHSTGDRKKSFWLSLLSGMAEPLGAVFAFLLMSLFVEFTSTTYGIIYGVVDGIMVFISLDELLPAAKEYNMGHIAVYGLIAGMIAMGVSMFLFML